MAKPKATHHAVFIVAHIHSADAADMLRYDNCCPANEENAHKMARAMRQDGADWIILKRFVALGAPKEPNHMRWKSFNIRCLPKAFDEFVTAEAAQKAVKADPSYLSL
jgi:hypothetical protein